MGLPPNDRVAVLAKAFLLVPTNAAVLRAPIENIVIIDASAVFLLSKYDIMVIILCESVGHGQPNG